MQYSGGARAFQVSLFHVIKSRFVFLNVIMPEDESNSFILNLKVIYTWIISLI